MTYIRLVLCSIALVIVLFGAATAMLLASAAVPDARHPATPAAVAFDLEDDDTPGP